jgi:hypothetical protein
VAVAAGVIGRRRVGEWQWLGGSGTVGTLRLVRSFWCWSRVLGVAVAVAGWQCGMYIIYT